MFSMGNSVLGTVTLPGGNTMHLSSPKSQLGGRLFFEQEAWAVKPHHSHRTPAKHSPVQQVFLQAAHLELAGKLPCWEGRRERRVQGREKGGKERREGGREE